MRVEVNGDSRELATGTTVGDLIEAEAGSLRGAAAVVDGEIVPRSSWPSTPLADGQVVELIRAVQGG